jgi:cysteine desulfurase
MDVYLDNNSTAPLDPKVKEVLCDSTDIFGNINSIYKQGIECRAAINTAYMKNHVGQLRDMLEKSIAKIPDTKSYVPKDMRLPNIVVASFKGIEGESMLWDMDQNGIHITTGSSCSSEDLEASAVVEALGEKTEIANATVMFALSRFTTHEEIEYVMEKLPKICERLREISMTYAKQEAYSAFVEDH